jgi:hypothetical protein
MPTVAVEVSDKSDLLYRERLSASNENDNSELDFARSDKLKSSEDNKRTRGIFFGSIHALFEQAFHHIQWIEAITTHK